MPSPGCCRSASCPSALRSVWRSVLAATADRSERELGMAAVEKLRDGMLPDLRLLRRCRRQGTREPVERDAGIIRLKGEGKTHR